jgi:hypothetical protein
MRQLSGSIVPLGEQKGNKLTPPASEHMKSMALPQQWSEVPGHEQSRVQ